MKKRFVVIDDDVSINFYSKLIIRKVFPDSEISTFSNPLDAVEYFKNTSAGSSANTIVLLDINMPELSGWEVLDKIEALNEVKTTFSIYMLSSSISFEDRNRAANHALVCGYIEKPLNKDKLSKIIG